MITLNMTYSDLSMITQALVSQIALSKNGMHGLSKRSSLYRMYANDISHCTELLNTLKNHG